MDDAPSLEPNLHPSSDRSLKTYRLAVANRLVANWVRLKGNCQRRVANYTFRTVTISKQEVANRYVADEVICFNYLILVCQVESKVTFTILYVMKIMLFTLVILEKK